MDPVAEVAPAAVAVEAFFRKHLVSSCGLPSYCWHFHLRPLLLLLLLLRHCSPPLTPEVAAAGAEFYLRSTPAPRNKAKTCDTFPLFVQGDFANHSWLTHSDHPLGPGLSNLARVPLD